MELIKLHIFYSVSFINLTSVCQQSVKSRVIGGGIGWHGQRSCIQNDKKKVGSYCFRMSHLLATEQDERVFMLTEALHCVRE